MLKPSVAVQNEDGILVAEFWDCLRLDPAPVRDLRTQYESHLRSKGKPDLVIDMNGVVFAGSASLGGFVALHRLSRQHGGRIVFCMVDENVLEVFQISKLSPMFLFVENREAAFAHLKSKPDEIQDGSNPANPSDSGKIPTSSQPPSTPRPAGPLRRNRKFEA